MFMRISMIVASLLASGCATKPLDRPEPARELLGSTDAAALGGRWANLTKYCVEADGSTSAIATVYPSGDPSLDQIYRDTVATWRFRPSSRQRCDNVRFDEDFGPERSPGEALSTGDAPGTKFHLKAIETPPPSSRQVAHFTKEAKLWKWALVNRTAFCVGPDGDTRDVETLRSSGLPVLDAYVRALVATWKYEPVTVDGRPACVSTEVTFNFKF